jgi:general secretion pathway protein D
VRAISPFLGELPIIGHLFRKDLEESDKTELVVLVTPKIVKSTQDWEQIKQNFINELENLNF